MKHPAFETDAFGQRHFECGVYRFLRRHHRRQRHRRNGFGGFQGLLDQARQRDDTSGDAGADLALRRTETNLRKLFRRAPWVTTKTSSDLLADTVALRAQAPGQARTPGFGDKIDALASRILTTFGASG